MKVLKPIPSSEVPERVYGSGRKRNPEYDKLIAQAQKMSTSKTLPVEFDDLAKAKVLYMALRRRIKKNSLKLNIFRVGNTVYLERVK